MEYLSTSTTGMLYSIAGWWTVGNNDLARAVESAAGNCWPFFKAPGAIARPAGAAARPAAKPAVAPSTPAASPAARLGATTTGRSRASGGSPSMTKRGKEGRPCGVGRGWRSAGCGRRGRRAEALGLGPTLERHVRESRAMVGSDALLRETGDQSITLKSIMVNTWKYFNLV